MMDGDHPEEDSSEILGDEDHKKYMMLIGMLNWIVCLGRMDVAFAVTSCVHIFVTFCLTTYL